MPWPHAICVFCGSPSCTCFDTPEEYEQAIREQERRVMPCTVCNLAPAVWSSLLLGTDDRLCRECVKLWYSEGVTSREEMQKRRREQEATVIGSAIWLEHRAMVHLIVRE